ncbi:Transcriptional activator protein CopR [Planctomycetes bacterium Poly30]|uniref:Transcriptional activator protein CopR n=1 Tax=Saltatorellus ferox TaxID=2528018 RepID=A0A518ENH5_9BACT|nr:Transcriptional activator protein CopR [Planctomycetes bacterium Poly30]
MHVCLIDDDPRLLETLQRGFHDLNHTCEVFSSPEEGLARLTGTDVEEPDVLLLDVMMPRVSGWEILERIRATGRKTPALYLTARQEVEDRVHGLELGADDYVIKPFAFTELMARIRAVLRRHGYQEAIEIGPLIIHRNRPKVECAGRQVEVSPREHAFLELLASHPGETFSRTDLLQKLWDLHFDPGTNIVEVLVARLRRKLGTGGSGIIETVIRQGYRISLPEEPTE